MLDLDLAPRRYDHIATAKVGDEFVIAHEGNRNPMVLDPVGEAIWSFLDGTTTLGQILDDLDSSLAGPTERHQAELEALILTLGGGAFIDSVRSGEPPVARRIDPPVADGSCLAMRLGLDRGSVLQVVVDGADALRFGSVDQSLAALVETVLPSAAVTKAPNELWLELLYARTTTGRRPRRQQILDTLGDPVFVSRSPASVEEALCRSVVGLVEARLRPESVWCNAAAIRLQDGIVLLHPSIAVLVIDHIAVALERAGLEFVRSTMVELDVGDDLILARLPSLPTDHGPRTLPVLSVLVPRASANGVVGRASSAAHVLRRWDQAHFEALGALARLTVPVDAPIRVADVARSSIGRSDG